MKVKELITYLQTLDQDTEIYFSSNYWMSTGKVGTLSGGPNEVVPYGYDGEQGYYWGT